MTPLLLAALLTSPAEAPAASPDTAAGLTVLPAGFTLTGPGSFRTVLVQSVTDRGVGGPVEATLTSSDAAVVRVEGGRAVAAGNGTAVLTATAPDGRTATAAVTVEQFADPSPWGFRNHVQSVLTKQGCNSGACHGALAGKGGFNLSLRGYDVDADHAAIVRHARGRRVVRHDPGRSLLLLKPTARVAHKGGLRIEEGSPEWRVLAEWIAAGTPPPADDDPRLERLEVLPAHAVLTPGTTQQLAVVAHFTDGHSEDVTRWAKYTAADATVCTVDDAGLVTVTGEGEGPVGAWYLANNVIATVTVPHTDEMPPADLLYPGSAGGDVWAAAPRANFIDDLVLEKLRELNLPPSPPAGDDEFIRRATLDATGRLPTPERVRAFLADDRPDRRARLVDELLASPAFVDYWANKWSDLLLVSGERLRPRALEVYSEWIRGNVAENTPWDEFARRVVTASGSTYENGAANFFALHQDPRDMAETTSAAFLGMSIGCAKCHDHPMEKWTNDQYFAFANLFGRVRGKGWGGDFRNGDGDRTVFAADDGDLIQPRTGLPQPPAPLDGEPLALDDPRDRRAYLAEWLTDAANPYFARAIVNRVWANYLGVGIVDPVDDLRLTNPPSNPALFAALADRLAADGYDLKRLMRLILTSETYRRGSDPLPGNAGDGRFYSHRIARRLKAEVLLDALSDATGVPTTFKDHPAGTRALQLPDVAPDDDFLDTFGRPDRLQTCACERSDMPSMSQALKLMNGETLNEKLAAPDNRLARGLAAGKSDGDLIDGAYLASLSRFPTGPEKARLLAVLGGTPHGEQRTVLEDLYWAILTSREFLFQH